MLKNFSQELNVIYCWQAYDGFGLFLHLLIPDSAGVFPLY